MKDSVVFRLIALVFIIYMIYHDHKLRNNKEYQTALQSKIKPRKKLLIKRWWSWLLIIFLILLSFVGSGEDYDSTENSNAKTETTSRAHKHNKLKKQKTKKQNKKGTHQAKKHNTKHKKLKKQNTKNTQQAKKPHKQSSQEKKKQKMLRILNMWAGTHNNYGVVKIDKDNAPMLILNDETVASSKNELEYIAIQFSNKIRAQQEMNHIELDNPAIYDKDGTPIAVWNGSTLELVDK